MQRLTPTAALRRFAPQVAITLGAAPLAQLRYGFSLGSLNLLIDADTVSEIIEPGQIYPLPHAANWLVGLFNLRGTILPLLDLYNTVQQPRPRRPRTLVMERGEQAVGIYVDDFPVAVKLQKALESFPPLPDLLKSSVRQALLDENGKVWLEFSHRRYFRDLQDITSVHSSA